MRRRGSLRWNGNSVPDESLLRRDSRVRNAGCFRPPRRARHRSIDRHRRQRRDFGSCPRAGAATNIARHWCPGTRPRGRSETGGGNLPGFPCCARRMRNRLQQQIAEIGRIQRFQAQPDIAGIARGLSAFAKLCESTSGISSGPRPRFFQPSISEPSVRDGQRFSSIFSASMICFISRS